MKRWQHTLIPTFLLGFLSCLPLGAESEGVLFSQAELDQMLAPIALYPDVLLSQVLMAATYPLEVVEASRWSRANPELEGDDAIMAVEDQDWDISVKTLTGFPELIQLMDDQLTWTRRLGDAFLLQEDQVMDTTQQLRQKSLETGSLDELEHITVEQRDNVIVIEPAEVEVVYVPYYSPQVVYGGWWWYDYPPFYWNRSPAYYSSIGFHWSRGFGVSAGFYFSSCDWNQRNVVIINKRRYPHRDYRDAPVWRHNPDHRRGVHYRGEELNISYHRSRVSGSERIHRTTPDKSQRSKFDTGKNKPRKRPERVASSGGVPRTNRSGQLSRSTSGKSIEKNRHVAVRPSKGDNRSSRSSGQVEKPKRTEKSEPKPAVRPAPSNSNRDAEVASSSNPGWTHPSKSNTASSRYRNNQQNSSRRPQKRPRAP